MAYKIKYDDKVLSVTSQLSYVTENQNGVLVPCQERFATFAIDEQDNLFRFVWLRKPIQNKDKFDFQEVTEIEEISEDELVEFRKQNTV